jgi:hypothetical protein
VGAEATAVAGVDATATVGGDGCTAGAVTLACCDAWLDVTLGGGAAPAATRSSLLGGWTVLVVIIAPPANPIAIAANAVPTPTK